MAKIFKIIFNCLLIIIIIVLVGYFVLRCTDKIRIYNVETGSMEDKIHPGDYILLYKKSDYHVGDIVTYRVNDYFITHRIISIDGKKVITKGDANNVEDAEISLGQIEGKAIYWGGILNFIINFKFVIAAFLVGLYLLTCYFGTDEKESIDVKDNDFNFDDIEETSNEIKEENEDNIEVIDENNNEEIENINEEIKDDEKEEIIEEIVVLDKNDAKIEEEKLKDIEIKEEVKKERKTRKKKTSTDKPKRKKKVNN